MPCPLPSETGTAHILLEILAHLPCGRARLDTGLSSTDLLSREPLCLYPPVQNPCPRTGLRQDVGKGHTQVGLSELGTLESGAVGHS